VTLDNGKRKYLSGKPRVDVAKKLATALQAREQATIITAPRQTVAQFFARWLEDVVRPNLRHTYAIRLFALGQHPRAVQDLLGHSRFEITMNLCTATVPEVLREAAERMDSVFVNARRQIGGRAVAALPDGRAHRAATPGRVAAQRPAKGSETASGEGI
jgi:integrase